MRELVHVILDQYQLSWHSLHGPAHWARVLENGRKLAGTTGARLDVVELFAVFHDACRLDDGTDHGHGRRGARLAESLRGFNYEIDDEGIDLLVEACSNHTSGWKDGDVTVQTCWDADRLDLARAGIIPLPGKLCTPAARDMRTLAWAIKRSTIRTIPALVNDEWGLTLE